MIKSAPIAVIVILVFWMLILCINTRERKAKEQREQKEAERLEKQKLAEQKLAERSEKIEQARETVSAGAKQLMSQARESAAAVTGAAKQIIADGNNPVGGAAQNETRSVSVPAQPEMSIVPCGTDEYALEKIKGLVGLLKSGFITQEEFDVKKRELLERL